MKTSSAKIRTPKQDPAHLRTRDTIDTGGEGERREIQLIKSRVHDLHRG